KLISYLFGWRGEVKPSSSTTRKPPMLLVSGKRPMNLLATLKGLFAPASYPETEFGMGNISFFLALLRACPEGSHLTFHQSETEAFVNAFREWSHRENPQNFEADYYAFDRRFTELAERLAAGGA